MVALHPGWVQTGKPHKSGCDQGAAVHLPDFKLPARSGADTFILVPSVCPQKIAGACCLSAQHSEPAWKPCILPLFPLSCSPL